MLCVSSQKFHSVQLGGRPGKCVSDGSLNKAVIPLLFELLFRQYMWENQHVPLHTFWGYCFPDQSNMLSLEMVYGHYEWNKDVCPGGQFHSLTLGVARMDTGQGSSAIRWPSCLGWALNPGAGGSGNTRCATGLSSELFPRDIPTRHCQLQ